MESQFTVEALALIEKTKHTDLPELSAIVLNAWCRQSGVSYSSIKEFIKRMSSHSHPDVTEVLTDMLGAYRVGAGGVGQQPDFN